jgi:osomolarity two-component system response regulator SSK1
MIRLSTGKLESLQEEEPTLHEVGVDFQLPSGSKFGFTWPADPSLGAQLRSDLPSRIQRDHPWADSAPATKEMNPTPTYHFSEENSPVPGPTSSPQQPGIHLAPPHLPSLPRAFSMLLPSQHGHLQHPNRISPGTARPATPALRGSPSTAEKHLQELSLELSDSVQTAVQTLIHLSPPHLFDLAKEQLSACAVQIPTVSISALLTSMKHLNYISANIGRFGSPNYYHGSTPGSILTLMDGSVAKDDFDIGELLQSVGDSLGGVAAEAEVDLVLHHGDWIKHMGVKGDECGISYAMSHVNESSARASCHSEILSADHSADSQHNDPW